MRQAAKGLSAITRRSVLQALGATTLVAWGAGRSYAQNISLRWWSAQNAPEQIEAYKAQIEAFQAANPGVTVLLETTSDESYPAQLAAAFSSGEVPDIVTHLPSFAAQSYYANGLVEPMNDVIAAIGEADFLPGANDVYKAPDGNYCAVGIGNTAANMLWVRRDLMQEAGVDKIPGTWDELRAACTAMQKNGMFGAPLPYGRNGMTSLIFSGFIHQAGGQIFTPDLQVAIDNDGTRNALEFYREMRELCPPGATNYSWGESLTAFVAGATATGIYGGRVLANVRAQNPAIADQLTCVTYPTISSDIKPWTFNGFPSIFVPVAAKNKDLAKTFAAFLLTPPGYIKQLLAAPGHTLPALKSSAENPDYLADELIKKYQPEVKLMAEAAAGGFNLGYESTQHRANAKGGEVVSSGAIADLVQRVVLQGENVDTVLSDTSKTLESLMQA